MDFCVGVYSVELDLLDLCGFGVCGALGGEVGGAGSDAVVGVVDVVEEDFLGLVAWGGYSGRWVSGCFESGVEVFGAYRLKKRPTPSLPRERQYWSRRAWWTHCFP